LTSAKDPLEIYASELEELVSLCTKQLTSTQDMAVFALADVYDALTSKRVYKSAYTEDAAREIIVRKSGSRATHVPRKRKLAVRASLMTFPRVAGRERRHTVYWEPGQT
jgi:hypothetical protein